MFQQPSPEGLLALHALGTIAIVSVPVFIATRMGGVMPLFAAKSKDDADRIAGGLTPAAVSAVRLDLFFYIPTYTLLFSYAAVVIGSTWVLMPIIALLALDVVETMLHLRIARLRVGLTRQRGLYAISKMKFLLFGLVFPILAILAIMHK